MMDAPEQQSELSFEAALARDDLTDVARRVLDACPVRVGVPPERLAAVAGVAVGDVLKVLPALELADLVEWAGTGWRLARGARA